MPAHTASRVLLSLSAVAVAATTAAAQTPQGQAPAVIRALTDCRAVREDAARLACFDAAAAKLESAERTGAVVVVDREQARAARREAFGFNLPSLNFFGRNVAVPEAERVELVLAGAAKGGDGRWVFRTENGQVWRQTDSEPLRTAKRGSKAAIRKASLGSFFMNVDGQRAVRVRREQ